MKVLINSRMRIRYAPHGIIVLEYRVKSFWGYFWKQVVTSEGYTFDNPEICLKRLQAERLGCLLIKRKFIAEQARVYFNQPSKVY